MTPDDVTVCALEVDDVPELSRHLASVFRTQDRAFLDHEHIRWKYFATRPDWDRPRSWALRDGDGALVSHLGIWPLHVELPDGDEPTVHTLDWTTTRPGVGKVLMRHVMDDVGRLRTVSIGGNSKSQPSFRKIGWEVVGSVQNYAVPVRPWKQLLMSRPRVRPSRLPRLMRNGAIARSRPKGTPAGWAAVAATDLTPLTDLLATRDPTVTRSRRTPALLDYFVASSPDCHAYLLSRSGVLVGYVVLFHRWGQTRIVELRIASEATDDWTAAVATAVEVASDDARTCEVSAAASSERLDAALRANGMTSCYERPIWTDDPQGLTEGIPPWDLQAADSEHVFLGDPAQNFMT